MNKIEKIQQELEDKYGLYCDELYELEDIIWNLQTLEREWEDVKNES